MSYHHHRRVRYEGKSPFSSKRYLGRELGDEEVQRLIEISSGTLNSEDIEPIVPSTADDE